MARWRYLTTKHSLRPKEGVRRFVCDRRGECVVHDLEEEERKEMEKVLQEYGDQGWELVVCHYHEGDMLCVWKRQEDA